MTPGTASPGYPGSVSDSFAAWLEASRQGSEDDLGRMLEACRGYLHSIAEAEIGSTLRPKASASDLVQDSLLDAKEGFERFRGTSQNEFQAWVVTILRRNLVDFVRRYRGTGRRAVGREESFSRLPQCDLPGQADGPSNRAERAEDAAQLQAAIARLPKEAQAVIAWRHEDGLGWEEIGARAGKTAEACRKIWFRAIERLRRDLGSSDDSTG